VVFTDADLSYAPDQVLALLARAEDGWDVVVGSRQHADTTTVVQAGVLRQVGGRVINRATRIVLVADHDDTQCGIKAFRSDVARLVFGHSQVDGFAFDVEVLHLAERYGLSVAEVPVVVENSDRSTVRVARDAVRLLRDLLRIRRWSRAGAYDLDEGDAVPARSAP
jgi:dolichyl-phosphate beta-glucosyltransferase